MLTHIVVWKYRADVDEATRHDHVDLLRRLENLLPGIISFKVGLDEIRLPRSFDTGLVAIFTDRSALDAYTIHPEHVAVADFGKTISEHVASVDFESQ
jgi:hypothetical protein